MSETLGLRKWERVLLSPRMEKPMGGVVLGRKE